MLLYVRVIRRLIDRLSYLEILLLIGSVGFSVFNGSMALQRKPYLAFNCINTQCEGSLNHG